MRTLLITLGILLLAFGFIFSHPLKGEGLSPVQLEPDPTTSTQSSSNQLLEDDTAPATEPDDSATTEITTIGPRGFARIQQPRPITVVFRYDDYSSISDTPLEQELINDFAAHHWRITFGVIPAHSQSRSAIPTTSQIKPLSRLKSRILRAAIRNGTVEAAQHGLTHAELNHDDQHPSEFCPNLSEEETYQRLIMGRDILQRQLRQNISIFVPPWDRCSPATLAALQRAGYFAISSAPTDVGDPKSTLRFLPKTCFLRDLPSAVDRARRLHMRHATIVVLFHSYDLEGPLSVMDLRGFSRLLDWVDGQMDVEVKSLGEALSDDPSLTSGKYMAYQHRLLSSEIQNMSEDQRRIEMSCYEFPPASRPTRHVRHLIPNTIPKE